MTCRRSSIFKILFLYKNFLTRKRHWFLTVILQIALPLVLLIGIWHVDDLISQLGPKHKVVHQQVTGQCKVNLFIVPKNRFTTELADRLDYCLGTKIKDLDAEGHEGGPCHYVNVETSRFDSEEDLLEVYQPYYSRNQDQRSSYVFSAALVFENGTASFFEKNSKYTIKMPISLPKELYAKRSNNPADLIYEKGYSAFQICVDEELIKIKRNDPNFRVALDTREMQRSDYVKPDIADDKLRQMFCAVVMLTFLITLCVETYFVSNEKASGINMLLSMNNVPYWLNLFSWLMSGLISSFLYTIPITVLLKYYYTEDLLPLLQYGNIFIFVIMLTLNVAHIITFGMHVAAYFTRPFFAIIGVLILYVSSTVLLKYGIKEHTFGVVPYFGIILPNILLFRVCEEFNYYERMVKGVCWKKIFQVGDHDYGLQGSIGMALVFSILGILFHFAMANYVYAMNPGKYGIKKSPFCFLKFLKNMRKSNTYDKVEDMDCNSTISTKLFEPVKEDCLPEIQVRKLRKSYRNGLLNGMKKCALKDVSIDFFEKQTTVLLGYNGSGKTTLLSILTGSSNPSEGLVLIGGKNVRQELDEVTRNLGFCPQENVLFPNLSVSQQLTFFNKLKNPNKPKHVVDLEVTALLEKLQLQKLSNALPKKLSGAIKRSVCLGIALIGNPKILILDEPTLGLNAERKRDIWNLLLKTVEHKTILIGTRDAEEANVLGDRVAMLHEGEVKCYGTPNYLKNLLGQENLQITLDTESHCETENIFDYFDPESEIVRISNRKMIFSVPVNDELPDSLDKIEQNKNELGVTGMTVSNFTLENVFLEATDDDSAPLASREPSCSTIDKLDSEQQSGDVLKALICKKATYTSNNISTILIILTMLFASLLCLSMVLIRESTSRRVQIPIRLDMYGNVTAYYNYVTGADYFAQNYQFVVEEKYGEVVWFQPNDEYYVYPAFNYTYHSFVGAEFQIYTYNKYEVNAIAMYNPHRARFALPIAINLVSNAVLKTVRSKDYSIEINYGELPMFKDNIEIDNLTTSTLIDGYVVAGILAFFLFPATAFFVVHPAREALSNVKHLQRMTGVSGVAYWGVMFAFDLLILFVISVLFVGKFVVADLVFSFNMFGWQETFILLLMFVLFAINVLPLVYAFSFSKRSASATIALLSLLSIFLVLVDVTISIVKFNFFESNRLFDKLRMIQKIVFLLTPYVSFFHGQVALFNNVKINSECRKVTNFANDRLCELTPCCNIKCVRGVCSNAVPYFKNFEDDVALETSVLAMCLTPILYFAILFILEYKVIPKILTKMCKKMPDNTDATFENQVKKVKHEIAFEASKVRENVPAKATANGNLNTVENGMDAASSMNQERKNYEFFVYELRKMYGNLVAVEDVSFGVQQNECFGILGASGAGKSTILKMISGKEISDHGMIHLRDEDYLKGMGYCPQSDALIKSLNAYDHLRLFARLRGISERKVHREVTKWVERLNLHDCASQPSETYSGSNRKRLNVAMALIGHPKLVLFDEPTKDLDPATKRFLWKIVQSCQSTGQTTILASESAEECLAVCKIFAVMAKGRFTYIGPSEEVKQGFGNGYDVQLKLNYETPEDDIISLNALKKEMSEVLPCQIVDENPGFLKFHVLPVERTWRQMYNLLFELKDKYSCIEEFYVLTPSQEQLFSKIYQTNT